MDNMIDFLRENAKFMAADRPDIYNAESALADLISWYNHLDQSDDADYISSGGFTLSKEVSPDGHVVEYFFARLVSSAHIYVNDGDFDTFNWLSGSATVPASVVPNIDSEL